MHTSELNTNKLLLYTNREALLHVQAIIHTNLQEASLYTKRETQHLHLALYERPFCAVIRSMHRLMTYHWTSLNNNLEFKYVWIHKVLQQSCTQ